MKARLLEQYDGVQVCTCGLLGMCMAQWVARGARAGSGLLRGAPDEAAALGGRAQAPHRLHAQAPILSASAARHPASETKRNKCTGSGLYAQGMKRQA